MCVWKQGRRDFPVHFEGSVEAADARSHLANSLKQGIDGRCLKIVVEDLQIWSFSNVMPKYHVQVSVDTKISLG